MDERHFEMKVDGDEVNEVHPNTENNCRMDNLIRIYQNLKTIDIEMQEEGFAKHTHGLINSLIIDTKMKIANEICDNL